MSTHEESFDEAEATLHIAAAVEFPHGFESSARLHHRQERALWDAVFTAATGGEVEYRTVASGGVLSATIRARPDRLAGLAGLLPYGYRADDEDVLAEPGGYEVTLTRRLGLVDLPRDAAFTGLAQIAIAAGTMPGRRRSITALTATGLVTRSMPVAARMAPPHRAARPEPERWVETLHDHAPAGVTVRLAPIADGERTVAADAYEALIGPDPADQAHAPAAVPAARLARHEAILGPAPDDRTPRPARSGSRPAAPRLAANQFAARGEFRRIKATLDRLRRPTGELVSAVVRVVAPTPASARAVAVAWAEAHGGARSFWASEPVRVASRSQTDARAPEGFPDQLADRAAALGLVEPVPSEAAPIYRMTRLLETAYTAAEFGVLMRLPVGPLAGLETAPASPFARSLSSARNRGRRAIDYGILATPANATIDQADVHPDHPLLQDARIVSEPLGGLRGHGALLGLVGMGKSHLLDDMCRQLLRQSIRVTIVDPSAAEHFGTLSPEFPELKRFSFVYRHDPGCNHHVMRFDVCRVPQGIVTQLHASSLVTTFASLMGMHLSLMSFFATGVRKYYTDKASPWACGLENSDVGGPDMLRIRGGHVFPSLGTLREFFLNDYIPSTIGEAGNSQVTDEWKQYFTARLDDLWLGPIGQMCREADRIAVDHFGADFDGTTRADGRAVSYADGEDLGCYDPFHEVADGSSVIEFESLGEDEKVGAMLFTVVQLSEHLLARYHAHQEAGERVPYQHALILEEAHNVAPNVSASSRGEIGGDDPKARLVAWMTNILAEFRKRGLGVLFVTQLPLRMAREIVELVDLLITFRITPLRQRKFLNATMGGTPAEEAYLSRLGLGRAVVRSRSIQTPVQIIVPPDGCGPFHERFRRTAR